tara:strand:- start:18 stop:866 length:849 start_codon:yes stop_codon:yes gene_type:complete
MATFDETWDFGGLSKAVCDILVQGGKLKEKPAFIRTDREAKITKVFTSASLDGAKMASLNARGVEVMVRNATEGEAWVDDVQKALKGMLSEEAAASTEGPKESDEMKQLREKQLERARTEFADGKPPPAPEGPGGGRRDRGERKSGERDDEAFGNFGGKRSGGGGGGDRACYNCGQMGHLSRDCPEPRQAGGGGGGGRSNQDDEAYGSFGGNRGGGGGDWGGGGGGGDRACYNCGQMGHISRDCPEARQEGGRGGGGGGNCYNCGQPGHQARDCPEPRKDRY